MTNKLLFHFLFLCLLTACEEKETPADCCIRHLKAEWQDNTGLKIIAVSKPDTVFGARYYSEREYAMLRNAIDVINEHITAQMTIEKAGAVPSPTIYSLSRRLQECRPHIMHLNDGLPEKRTFSGWRIRIDYEIADPLQKQLYTAKNERWYHVSKDMQNILEYFDLPLQ